MLVLKVTFAVAGLVSLSDISGRCATNRHHFVEGRQEVHAGILGRPLFDRQW